MSVARTPDVVVKERRGSCSRGGVNSRTLRSRPKPSGELTPRKQGQQPSQQRRTSAHGASNDATVTSPSPKRINSAPPPLPLVSRQTLSSLTRAPSSHLLWSVHAGHRAEANGMGAAAAGGAGIAKRAGQPSQFSAVSPMVAEQIKRMRHIMREVKLPFMDVSLIETHLFRPAQGTPATESVGGECVSDVRASTERTSLAPTIGPEAPQLPRDARQGVEARRTSTTRRVSVATLSRRPRLQMANNSKSEYYYPLKASRWNSERHQGSHTENAAAVRAPPRWGPKRISEDEYSVSAQAHRCANALDASLCTRKASGIIEKTDVRNREQAEENYSCLPPHPPRPLRCEPRLRHRQQLETTSPPSLLDMMEHVLTSYKEGLDVARRAVMHRDVVCAALQQFLSVVRSHWRPPAAHESLQSVPVASQKRDEANATANRMPGCSRLVGALPGLRSPHDGFDGSGAMAAGSRRSEARVSPHYTPHGMSSSARTAESECDDRSRSRTPDQQAPVQTSSELSGTVVDSETTRSSSAPSLKRAAPPPQSATRHEDTCLRKSSCGNERQAYSLAHTPEAVSGAEKPHYPPRQQRPSVCLSADSLRETSALLTSRAASSIAAVEGSPSRMPLQSPPRTRPRLIRFPVSTPPWSARAARTTSGPLGPARPCSVTAHSHRALDYGDTLCLPGEGGRVHSAAAHRTLALREALAAFSSEQQACWAHSSRMPADGAGRRSRSAPCLKESALQSPCPPHHSSFFVAPRARIMARCDAEARVVSSPMKRLVFQPIDGVLPTTAGVCRPLQASVASPHPRRQEVHDVSAVSRPSRSESNLQPHSCVGPSLGIRPHGVCRQVYADCLHNYLYYIQRTTLAVVEAVGQLRRRHLSHAAPFVVEDRNYFLEALIQTSILACDPALQRLMHESSLPNEGDRKPVTGQPSDSTSTGVCGATLLLRAAPETCDHVSDGNRCVPHTLCTNYFRQCSLPRVPNMEAPRWRVGGHSAQRSVACGQWPEQLLLAPLMSTYVDLAQYAATPRFLARLEESMKPIQGVCQETASGTTQAGDGGRHHIATSTTPPAARASVSPLALVLPVDILALYGGDAAAAEAEQYSARITDTYAIRSKAVPSVAALRRRLECGEHLLHLEVETQLAYLQSCMRCAVQHEYPLFLRGMTEVHRSLYVDKDVPVFRCGPADQACVENYSSVDPAGTGADSPAKQVSAGVRAKRDSYDRVFIKDELCLADWMKGLQKSWQLLLSGSSSLEHN